MLEAILRASLARPVLVLLGLVLFVGAGIAALFYDRGIRSILIARAATGEEPEGGRVPEAVPPSTHELKYSLFYGYPGRRVVGFDNERGKGDHRHIEGEGEQPYTFTTVEALVADFLHAVRAAKGEQT